MHAVPDEREGTVMITRMRRDAPTPADRRCEALLTVTFVAAGVVALPVGLCWIVLRMIGG